ncbi:MAG: EVE domain-containing protein [Nitrososphaerota archaeon]
MKKLFVQYPNFRSSTRKFDPCVMQNIRAGSCRNCKVFVTSDRFLGEKRQMRLVGSLKRFPYVIIMDTAGCNLRCWFCYSHQFWKPDDSCEPVLLSSDDVIKQLRCKIEKICEVEGKLDRKPFTSIRISGGEPIYADQRTMMPYDSDKKIDYASGINYWLEFIAKLDVLIGELKEKKKINIVAEDCWDRNKGFPWPTFVSDVKDRMYIRFDTNGIAFGSNEEARRVLGGPENAKHFIGGLFDLHRRGELRNVKIWITYSLKGACPNEYYWSQRKKLPTSEENENYDFSIDEHPQHSGYKNLREEINRCIREYDGFRNCVDISVEKGINHDLEHNIYMYNPEAFKWQVFEEKSGIKLSEVKNDICIIYTFGGGPWGLYKVTPGLIKRYFNQGAEIIVESSSGTMRFCGDYAEAKRATNFIGSHYLDSNFKIIIRPITVLERMEEVKPVSIPQRVKQREQHIFGWILSGSPSNWKVALERNIWGLRPQHKPYWLQVKNGDTLFLYATRPVSGVVGIAIVKKTVEEDKPFWPDEIVAERVKYPFRIEFEPVKILNEDEWEDRKISLSSFGPIYFQGINPIVDEVLMKKLNETIKRKLMNH